LEVPGGSDEELRGRLLLGRGTGGRVDYGLGAHQRLGQPVPGDYVDSARARHRHDVMALGLEDVHDVTANPPGRARHCDLPTCVHDVCSRCSGAGAGHIGLVSSVNALTPDGEGM
jgi:hypothetical protein